MELRRGQTTGELELEAKSAGVAERTLAFRVRTTADKKGLTNRSSPRTETRGQRRMDAGASGYRAKISQILP